jgi:hypothetical protein
MVPSRGPAQEKGTLVIDNKRVYICFLGALALMVFMAASPMHAEMSASRNADVLTGTGTGEAKQLVVRVDPRTKKLVRTFVSDLKKPQASPKRRTDLAPMVEQAAKTHNLDPLLVDSVIQVESNYNPYAISPKGAEGLMQLMPATARMLGVSNAFDPQQNIEAGVRYLKQLKDLYKGDDRLALAAYNAGPGAVDKYKWVPPYAETQSYVNEVGKRYGDAQRARAISEKASEQAAAKLELKPQQEPAALVPVEDKHPKLEQFVDADGRLHLSTKRE